MLFAALAILLSLLATAAVGEGVLRLAGYSPSNVNPLKSFHEFDPVLGWRGRKLYTARFKRPDFDVVIAQNAAGFRKQVNLEAKLDKAPHRIFVFGDSFVWGWGVGQGEVFTDRMNLLLPNYSVHNYGIDGIGTVVEYLLFSTEVRKLLRPDDVVLLMFCNNDFADNVDRKKVHAEAVNGDVKIVNPAKPLTTPFEDWLKNHSYLCNFVWYRADLYRLTRVNRNQEDETLGRTITETDERFVVTQAFPGEVPGGLRRRRKRGSSWPTFPRRKSLPSPGLSGPTSWPTKRRGRRPCLPSPARLHIETIDLLPGFLARKNKTGETLTFKTDGHWNRTGHQAVAELLSEYLSTYPLSH